MSRLPLSIDKNPETDKIKFERTILTDPSKRGNGMEKGAKLSVIADKLHLKNFTPEIHLDECYVKIADINRPALQLNDFYEHFEKDRIQLIGMVEWAYLDKKTKDEKIASFKKLLSYDLPCIIFCRGFIPEPEIVEIARNRGIPFLGTERGTSEFMSELIYTLNYELAPMTSIHGVLVDVYGEGLLIMGWLPMTLSRSARPAPTP